jgi:hypothetical protein
MSGGQSCAFSLLGWVFSFTWGGAVASFLLSVWFERESKYRRRFDELQHRFDELQHQVTVTLTTLHVP